jgi:hypothetical protein
LFEGDLTRQRVGGVATFDFGFDALDRSHGAM